MKGLGKGITGKSRTDGNHGAISSFSDDNKSPKKSGSSISHPGPSNTGSEGMVPLGSKLTPKGNV